MNGATVSTHVLHLGTGRPVAGIAVRLEPGDLRGVTGGDGRLRFDGEIETGTYTLRFDLAGTSELYGSVALEVRLDEPRHYHLPLLVLPFGLSAYRGT